VTCSTVTFTFTFFITCSVRVHKKYSECDLHVQCITHSTVIQVKGKTHHYHHHHYHHHISVMELCHLLARSGLTYPEVSSKICHNSFCQLGNSASLPWVIYYEAFYLHFVSSFSCIPVICLELVSVLWAKLYWHTNGYHNTFGLTELRPPFIYKYTLRHIPEYLNNQRHLCESLKTTTFTIR